MAIMEIIISTAIEALIMLIIKGVKIIVNFAPEARKKLIAVYLEVNANKTALAKTIDKDGNGAPFGSKEFKQLAASLSNTATKPLYRETKTVRRAKIAKGSKKREQINRVQYALNYTVRQIDELKILSKQKTAQRLRLSVRLRTLAKHLNHLEMVLRPVK